MNYEQLDNILRKLPDITVLVVGDYFLDKYLLIDPKKDEPSIETGLTAYQVVGKRLSPGAAGTVTNNLCALGVGRVVALGVIGDDGEGKELVQGLQNTGVDTSQLIVSEKRVTPTYAKPMLVDAEGERELNRLDIKNWSPTPPSIENRVIETLRRWARQVDAVIVMDQIAEADHGTVTGKVREALGSLANEHPDLPIMADSRAYIEQYRHVMIKPNHHEAIRASQVIADGETSSNELQADSLSAAITKAGTKLNQHTKRPVFITNGPNGQYVFDNEGMTNVPGFPVHGPIDTVGAGDSTTAGMIAALCCKSSLRDAAYFGNLVASITIQKLGTTGTASPEEVRARWKQLHEA